MNGNFPDALSERLCPDCGYDFEVHDREHLACECYPLVIAGLEKKLTRQHDLLQRALPWLRDAMVTWKHPGPITHSQNNGCADELEQLIAEIES